MRRSVLGLASFVIAILLASVTSNGSASAADTSVSVGDNFYSPAAVSINVGDTVTWNWGGALPHTVTANDGSFDSGDPQTTGSFAFTFNSAGTYSYFCEVHGQAMSGTVTVAAAAAGGAEPTATAAAAGSPTAAAAAPTAAATASQAATVPATTGSTPAAGGAVTAPSTGTGPGPSSSDSLVMPLLVAVALGITSISAALAVRRLR